MALSRVTTWISGDVLTAAALNGEFNNLLNNALSLISPLTGTLDFNNNQATNFRFENRTADLATGQAGRAWVRTDQEALKIDVDGAAVRFVPAMLTPATGQLILGGGATGYVGLAIGSAAQVLTVSGGTAVWAAAGGSTSVLQVQVFS